MLSSCSLLGGAFLAVFFAAAFLAAGFSGATSRSPRSSRPCGRCRRRGRPPCAPLLQPCSPGTSSWLLPYLLRTSIRRWCERCRSWWREDMLRAGPLQPAEPPAGSPQLQNSPTVLAHWAHRKALRGPVPSSTAMSDPGTVRARGHGSWPRSSRSRRKKRGRTRLGELHGVEPAAETHPGRPRKWIGEHDAPVKEGGTAGALRGDLVPSESNAPPRSRRRRTTVNSYRAVPPQVDLPLLESEVLDFWHERRIFEASVARNEGAPTWTFYEGPPTANGRPGTHHIESRTFKDVFPRFKTMQGFQVNRKGGWDCHGLPVELAVEKELGFSGKADIEAFGIAEFNARCRESVQRHVNLWEQMTDRMGCWIDMRQPYRTMDSEYVQSVWWALKQIHGRGLLVEDYRVAPYCPRCGTGLSDHELAQGYETVTDPSVYVRLPLTSGPYAGDADLLIWTTTPWTLVSNALVAAHPGPDLCHGHQGLRHAGGGRGAGGEGTRRGLDRDRPVHRRRDGRLDLPAPLRAGDLARAHRWRPGSPERRTSWSPRTTSLPRTGPGWCTSPPRSARTTSPRVAATVWPWSTRSTPRGTSSTTSSWSADSSSGTPTPISSTTSPSVTCSSGTCPTSTAIRTAGGATPPCSTTHNRRGTSAPPRSRAICSPRTTRPTGSPRPSSTAATATGWRTTSTGRSPGAATGVRRCRSGAAVRGTRPASVPWRSSPS